MISLVSGCGIIQVVEYESVSVNQTYLNQTINRTTNFNQTINRTTNVTTLPECCYPIECPQAKYNPEVCDCIYTLQCIEADDIIGDV